MPTFVSTATESVSTPTAVPTVVTKTKVSLAEHLDLRNLPLSTTPAGKNFVIKALHPADSEIKTNRIPGGLMPSVGLCADMVDTIPFPAGATGCYLVQTPNIWVPLSIIFTNASGNYVDHYLWTNSGLGGPGVLHAPTTWPAIVNGLINLYGNMSAYRVTAQSVTCDIVAPMTADQGTIVSCQFDSQPRTQSGAVMGNAPMAYNSCADVWLYGTPPTSNSLLMGTSAYTAKAREGFYQPLRINNWKFHALNDSYVQMHGGTTMDQLYNGSMPVNHSNWPIYFNNIAYAPTHVCLPKPTSSIVGVTWVEGTAGNPNVSLRIRARQVIEFLPVPGGTYAPLSEAPYPPDELALKMVREIGARMKDAYPSSYNSLGKLKDTISKIGGAVLKFADPALDALSMIPGLGTFAGGLKSAKNLAQGVASLVASGDSKAPPLPERPSRSKPPSKPRPKPKQKRAKKAKK